MPSPHPSIHFNPVSIAPLCDSFAEQLEVAHKRNHYKSRQWVTKGQASRLWEIFTPRFQQDRHYSSSVKLRLGKLPGGHSGVKRTELKKGHVVEVRIPIEDIDGTVLRMCRVRHTYFNLDQCWWLSE